MNRILQLILIIILFSACKKGNDQKPEPSTEKKLLVDSVIAYVNGKITTIDNYDYDNRNRLVFLHSKQDPLFSKTTYTYDDQNHLIGAKRTYSFTNYTIYGCSYKNNIPDTSYFINVSETPGLGNKANF